MAVDVGVSSRGSLEKQLASPRVEVVEAALAAAREQGDPALYDRLLDGVTWDEERGWLRRPAGGFGGSHHALVSLIVDAPPSSRAAALGEQLTRLTLGSREHPLVIDRDRWFPRLCRLAELSLEHVELRGAAPAPALRKLSVRSGSIERLSGMPALVSLAIEGARVPEDLAGLAESGSLAELVLDEVSVRSLGGLVDPAPALRSVRLRHCVDLSDASALARAPALEVLELRRATSLQDLGFAASLRALRDLWVNGCPRITSLRPLGDHPALEKLHLTSCSGLEGVEELGACPPLRELSLSGCERLAGVRGLERLPSLERLWLTSLPELTELAPLAPLRSLVALDLSGCGALRSLRGLPEAPSLSSLGLRQCAALESLDGLPPLPRIIELDLGWCAALRDLSGIERLTRLQVFKAWSANALEDVSALAGLPELRVVDLQYCAALTRIDALEGHPPLKIVALASSGVERKAVGQGLKWACTWARSPDFEALAKRAPPRKASSGSRTTLASLKKLLGSSQRETVDQGVELLAALGAPELYDELLARVVYRGGKLQSASFKAITASYAILALIASAPEGSARAAALREAITRYEVFGLRADDPTRPFDPLPLEALPNLTEVSLTRVRWVHRARPPVLRALRELKCDEVQGLDDLSFLEAFPSLQSVYLAYTRVAGGIPEVLRDRTRVWPQ